MVQVRGHRICSCHAEILAADALKKRLITDIILRQQQ